MTSRMRSGPRGRATPHFRTLSRRECEALLRRNVVGRLAYSCHDRVDVEPIHFVFARGALFGRTSEGTKLDALRHSPRVAFEVDEVEGLHDWRSVVAHGTLFTLENSARAEAVALLRTVFPLTESEEDPTPDRDVVFHIVLDEMTGRSASS